MKWFKAMYIVTSHKKGISSYQLGKDLGFTQKTAWFVLGRIRKLVEEKTPFMLSGNVQVDESFVGGKLSNRHKSFRAKFRQGQGKKIGWNENKGVVLGLVSNEGKVVTKVMLNVKKESILPEMLDHVATGSTIVTDEWKVYKNLVRLGYKHESVHHAIEEYVRDGFTTNRIEGVFSLLKRGIYGIFHQVSKKHLHRYCNEFSFRYNIRELKESERFLVAAKRIENTRLKYADYIKSI